MIIGFDAKRYFHNSSGLGNYSRFLVHHLAKQLPDDELLLYDGNPSGNASLSNVKNRAISYPSSLRRFWNLDAPWKEDNLDIYHGLSNELPLTATKSVKTIVTIHDVLYRDFPSDYSWIDCQIYDLKFRKSCHLADAVVAISEKTKYDIINRFEIDDSKVHVIYQSCDPSFFQSVHPDSIQEAIKSRGLDQPYFICVGSFTNRKNQKRLIEAFAHSSLSSSMKLVFVGRENKFLRQLKKLSSRYKIDNQVHFLIDVGSVELKHLIKGSHSVVYPSIKEGFGLPVLEGLAMGKAVITSRNTSCNEAGGEAVLTFDAENTEELKTQLEQIVYDDTLRIKLENLGVGQANSFSPSEELPKLIKLYRQLIG